MCMTILFTTYVWPSVCGWKEVYLMSLVSNNDHKLDQNVLKKLLSWSEIMVCGSLKWTNTHSKKELTHGLSYYSLPTGGHNGHLQEMTKNHEKTVIVMLGWGEALHVIHRDGVLGPIRSQHGGVQPILLNGRLSDGVGSTRSDILADILLELWPIKILLQYYHDFFHAKVSYHLSVMVFPNHLFSLTWRYIVVTQMEQQSILAMKVSNLSAW